MSILRSDPPKWWASRWFHFKTTKKGTLKKQTHLVVEVCDKVLVKSQGKIWPIVVHKKALVEVLRRDGGYIALFKACVKHQDRTTQMASVSLLVSLQPT